SQDIFPALLDRSRLDTSLCAHRISPRLRFALPYAIGCDANGRPRCELAVHCSRRRGRKFWNLSRPLFAFQQLGCAVEASGPLSWNWPLGFRSARQFQFLGFSRVVRDFSVCRLRDALWSDAPATRPTDAGPAKDIVLRATARKVQG